MAQVAKIQSKVGEVILETPDTVTLSLLLDRPLPHIPGQSVGIDPKQFDRLQERIALIQKIARERKLRALTNLKLYSLADSEPDFGTLYITIKIEEDKENYPPALLSPYAVGDMRAGDPVLISGPYGKNFLFEPTDGDLFLLWGAGSGIVPLRYFLEFAHRNNLPNQIRLFDSNKTPGDIIYRERLDFLEQANSNVRVIHTITRPHLCQVPWNGRTGRLIQREDPEKPETVKIPADILELADGIPVTQAWHYVCGPLDFAVTVRQALENHGVSRKQISLEAWG